jgi:hypothetical protein
LESVCRLVAFKYTAGAITKEDESVKEKYEKKGKPVPMIINKRVLTNFTKYLRKEEHIIHYMDGIVGCG